MAQGAKHEFGNDDCVDERNDRLGMKTSGWLHGAAPGGVAGNQKRGLAEVALN